MNEPFNLLHARQSARSDECNKATLNLRGREGGGYGVAIDPIINIAAYLFAPLNDLKSLRARLAALGQSSGLKGTILLSTEGINLFVAGSGEAIQGLLGELRAVRGLEGLAPKFSESVGQPFTRMLVRIKKEIIAFGVEGIEPARRTSPKLAARTLRQWLDEGRPVTLLDTRNDYEVKLGTFQGAQALGIDHFREFPAAVQALSAERAAALKEQPVVMFCTGGIRCEKAGPFMEREGYRNIFQLDGGILRYFEECGGAHYEGECFVFDQRVGVDPALRETPSAQCYRCQTPLDAEDQRDPRFVAGESCPYCYQERGEKMAQGIAAREAALALFTTPLPGSVPQDNRRPVSISKPYDGLTLLAALATIFPQMPRADWQRELERGRFVDERGEAAGPERVVRAGERYYRLLPAEIEPTVNAGVRILHEDEAIVVLHKPAPLPMHPCGRFSRNTLQHFLDHVYAPFQPRPAHRLDANTSGVVVCARTRKYARMLQPQFARGEVEKTYLVRVLGHPERDEFTCNAPISAEPGPLGTREVDEEGGREARTDFTVRARLADSTALLEARPRTGRTNQIRVHLSQLGTPVCGDPAYLVGQRRGAAMTLSPSDPPLCLHAWKLAFTHPLSGDRVSFEAEPPSWATGVRPEHF